MRRRSVPRRGRVSRETRETREDREARLYAYAHALGEKADRRASNTLTVEELLELALSRGINAEIVPIHGRLMATAGRVYIPTEIVCVQDIERLARFVEPPLPTSEGGAS